MFRLTIDAFFVDPDTRLALETARSDIALTRSSVRLHEGGIPAALEFYEGKQTPDLLVVETTSPRDQIEEELKALSEIVSGPGTEILLIGREDNIQFYRRMLDFGIGEYLLSPMKAPDFLVAIRKVFGEERATRRGKTYTIMGAKGGVGASTIANNLAWAIREVRPSPTILMDFDLHFGTTTLDYNIDPRAGLRDALVRAATADVDEGLIMRLLTKDIGDQREDDPNGMWMLASNPSAADSGHLTTSENIEKVLDAAGMLANHLVVDLPRGWSSNWNSLLLAADETIIVTDPSISGLRNTHMIFEAVARSKPAGTRIRYVVNMAGVYGPSDYEQADFVRKIGQSPLAWLPWDPKAFRKSKQEGKLLAAGPKYGDLSAGKEFPKLRTAFLDMANTLLGVDAADKTAAKAKAKKGFLASFGMGRKKNK